MADTITLARVAITTDKDHSFRNTGLDIKNTILHGSKIGQVLRIPASSGEVRSNMDHRSPARNIKSYRQVCRTTGVVNSDIRVQVFAPHDHGTTLGSGSAEREFGEVSVFRVQRDGVFSSKILGNFRKICLKQLRLGEKHQVRFIEICEVLQIKKVSLNTLTIPANRGELQESLRDY